MPRRNFFSAAVAAQANLFAVAVKAQARIIATMVAVQAKFLLQWPRRREIALLWGSRSKKNIFAHIGGFWLARHSPRLLANPTLPWRHQPHPFIVMLTNPPPTTYEGKSKNCTKIHSEHSEHFWDKGLPRFWKFWCEALEGRGSPCSFI